MSSHFPSKLNSGTSSATLSVIYKLPKLEAYSYKFQDFPVFLSFGKNLIPLLVNNHSSITSPND
jgi:hypothetical protein